MRSPGEEGRGILLAIFGDREGRFHPFSKFHQWENKAWLMFGRSCLVLFFSSSLVWERILKSESFGLK